MDVGRASQLLQRLPLPLAQTLRRALNAKSPEGSHLAAYYFFESMLKLASAAQISVYLEVDGKDPHLNTLLESIARPSVGHWLGIWRETAARLAARPDAALIPLAGLHGRLTARAPRPWAAAFLQFAAGARGETDNRSSVTLLDLFDAIVAYRNNELGHGGQRTAAFYAQAAPLLIEAVSEAVRELEPFGELALCVARDVADVRTGATLRRYDQLRGDGVHVPFEDQPRPADAQIKPGRLLLCGPGVRVNLHPFAVYEVDDFERDRVGCLNKVNARRRNTGEFGVKNVEYLDYDSGARLQSHNPVEELAALLTRISGRKVDAGEIGVDDDEPAAPAQPEGQWIGGFRILGELGRGGMGIVYKAEQASLNRIVALKVLPPSVAADPIAVARFRREIAALGRCDHPNVIKVLAAGQEGERHYYAMEYVEGSDLAGIYGVLTRWKDASHGEYRQGHLLQALTTASRGQGRVKDSAGNDVPVLEQPMPQIAQGRNYYQSLAEIMAQAAAGVAHLHQHGIVHRDLKPGNIMLTSNGERAVIMDLGLAQMQDRSLSLTQSSVKILGTLRYMPPEQLQHQMLEVTESADVYSLGATLYELAALAPIHDGDSEARLIQQVLQEEPKAPRDLNAAVPRELETIIRVATSKLAAERYASAKALQQDLESFARGEPIVARAPSAFHYLRLFYFRNKPLVATVAAALAVLLALASYFVFSLSASRNEALTQKDLAEKERALAQAQQKVATEQRDEADHQRREAEHQKGEAQRQQELATTARGAAEREEQNAKRAATQAEAAEREARRNLAASIILHGDALLAGGRYREGAQRYEEAQANLQALGLNTLPAQGGLMMCNASSPPRLFALGRQTFGDIQDMAVVPGSRLLLLATAKGVIEWDLDQWRQSRQLQGHTDVVNSLALSRDATLLVTGSGDTTVRLWDFKAGTTSHTLYGHSKAVLRVALTPDGTRALSCGEDGDLICWDTQSGELKWRRKAHQGWVPDCALAPDGKRLLTVGQDGFARIWDVESGETLRQEEISPGAMLLCCCWPASGELVLGGSAGFLGLWQADEKLPLRRLVGHEGNLDRVVVDAAGTTLITGATDDSTRVWDFPAGLPRFAMEGHFSNTRALALSGASIYSAGSDAKLWEFAASDGARKRVLENHAMGIVDVAVSPDGSTAASCSTENSLRVWDIRTGRQLAATRGTSTPSALCFLPDGRSLLVGDEDGGISTLEISSGKWQPLAQGHRGQISHIALSADGKYFATSGWDLVVCLWQVGKRQSLRVLRGHTLPQGAAAVNSGGVAFSPDGKFVGTAGGDGCMRLWDFATGESLFNYQAFDKVSTGVAFLEDGKWLVASAHDGKVVGIELGPRTAHEFYQAPGPVTAMAASPDSHFLAFTVGDGEIGIFDTAKLTIVRKLYAQGDVRTLAFHPGSQLLLSGSNPPALELWDVQVQPELTMLTMPSAQDPRRAIGLSDPRLAASITTNGWVRIHDLELAAPLLEWKAHEGWVAEIVQLDATRLATCGEDKTIAIWELATGKLIRRLQGHTDPVNGLVVLPDGRLCTSSWDNTFRLWNPNDGQCLATWPHPTEVARPIQLSPDGTRLLLCDGYGRMSLAELSEKGRLEPLMGGATSGIGDWIRSLTFSPDGKFIASGHEQGAVSIWDVTQRRFLRRFQAHEQGKAVTFVSYTPDGRYLLTTGEDNSRRMWDPATGREVFVWTSHNGVALCTFMSADGHSIVVTAEHGGMAVQRMDRAARYKEFQARLPRALETLQANPDDANALALLGQWFAFRGQDDWALQTLRAAEQNGAEVDRLLLARVLWHNGDRNSDKPMLTEALAKFRALAAATPAGQDKDYFELCAKGVQHGLDGLR